MSELLETAEKFHENGTVGTLTDGTHFTGREYGLERPAPSIQSLTRVSQKANEYFHECPCCGSPLKNQHAHVDVNSNRFVRDNVAVPLSAKEAKALDLLMRVSPRPASFDTIISNIYDNDEPENAALCVRVFMCRARKKLKEIGVAIRYVPGAGYAVSIA